MRSVVCKLPSKSTGNDHQNLRRRLGNRRENLNKASMKCLQLQAKLHIFAQANSAEARSWSVDQLQAPLRPSVLAKKLAICITIVLNAATLLTEVLCGKQELLEAAAFASRQHREQILRLLSTLANQLEEAAL